MAQSVVRVIGGGNTYIMLGNGAKRMRLLASANDTPGRVNGTNPTAIQGVGDKYPFEIVTGYSQTYGTLVLTVYQVWGRDGWVSMWDESIEQLKSGATGGGGANNAQFLQEWNNSVMNTMDRTSPADVVEMLEAQRSNDGYIAVSKVECGADGKPVRIKKYMGCVITDMGTGENITNNAMENTVTVTMAYTHAVIVNAKNTGIADQYGFFQKRVTASMEDWSSGN